MPDFEIIPEQKIVRGYASVKAAQPLGAGAELVTVEADITRGLHAFSIIGLPNKTVEEARNRIAAAIRHTGFKSPKATNRRIVLSFSPADLRKEGSHYDVPLALCYLAGAEEITLSSTPRLFAGELSLDGTIKPARGILSQIIAAKRAGIKEAYVPYANANEAALVKGIRIYAPSTLFELVQHLKGEKVLTEHTREAAIERVEDTYDLGNIKGQEGAKRALEIAAAGRHNIVLYGPPGTGKTMLARALPGILPPLTEEELLEVTAIHSTAGILPEGEILSAAPFRAPHHTISYAAMVGGGSYPRAGEVTLAHKGVLFLDEFPEFASQTLEALRQPLEDRSITVSRSRATFTFPADCMIVAAMNPAETLTIAADEAVRAARKQSQKISRPIADRLDMWVEVPHLTQEELRSMSVAAVSAHIRDRVAAARERAGERMGIGRANASLSPRELDALSYSIEADECMREAGERLSLSPRAYHRTLRVARTIADLEGSERIEVAHVYEALQYRPRGVLGYV
jgi:magnesium chelatase family protein